LLLRTTEAQIVQYRTPAIVFEVFTDKKTDKKKSPIIIID